MHLTVKLTNNFPFCWFYYMHFQDFLKYFRVRIIIRTASTKRKMVKTWFIKVTGDLNYNFGSIMELLRDNWEIIQLQSIFTSPLQNILSIACRTLWSLLFTAPWEPQNRCPAEWVHCFYTHSIFHSLHPYQFSLQIYLHNIASTSQGGLE